MTACESLDWLSLPRASCMGSLVSRRKEAAFDADELETGAIEGASFKVIGGSDGEGAACSRHLRLGLLSIRRRIATPLLKVIREYSPHADR